MDGAGPQPIYYFDVVTIRQDEGAHDERGVVIKYMPGEKLGVLRADGTMVSARQRDLVVVDRGYFQPGHVVAAASDPGGQIGVVTGVATAVDLVRFSSDDSSRKQATVARGVSAAGLRRVTELSVGDLVVSGPWLGRVLEVSLDVGVLFDDGALCRVTGPTEHKLEAADMNRLTRLTDCLFYPGQRVTAGCPSVFKASRWIRGHWKPTRSTRTVARVDTAGVVVCWVASMHLGTSKPLIQASAPPAYQSSPHELEIFRSVSAEPSHWCVGDRCLFRCHEHPQGNSASSTTTNHTSSPAGGLMMKSHRKRRIKRTSRQAAW